MSEVAVSRDFGSNRLLALIILWALFVLWLGLSAAGDISMMAGSGASGYGGTTAYAIELFALDIWALMASLAMGLIGFNPFGWLNGKRLIIGSMAFAVMLGRLIGGWFTYGLHFIQAPPEVVVVIMPLVLLLSGVAVMLAIAAFIGLLFGFLVFVPVMMVNQLFAFDREIAKYRYNAKGLAGYIVRAVYWLRNERRPATPPDDSKGARFATQAEAAAIHNETKDNPARMGFGHWPGKTDTPFFIATGKHVLVMASTRSGKGVALIIPHLLRYRGSAFVLDPKGENARATGRQRARLNGSVHYLDPFGITGKPPSRFNPLSRFTPETMEAESKALAAAMFVVEPHERSHWTESGQQLLAAIILYVYVTPTIAPERKDLPTVRKVLLGLLDSALKEMILLDDADGLLRDLAISFLRTPPGEFGSIVSTAQRQTEILDNPFMQACLAGSGDAPEVDFGEWHRGTMTVYLCLAAPKFPTFNRWLRLVLTAALDTMTERLNPPKLPVCFMLDELATLGRLTAVENAVGLSAGYGIQLVAVFQDVAQMRGLYDKRWASFVGNAGVRALFNLDDHETADYWSKFIGGRLVETYGRQEDRYGLSSGQNIGEDMRPLLPADKLMMDFASGKMLVLAQGARPIVTDRVPYFDDQSLTGLWEDPRGLVKPAAAAAAGSVPPTGPAGPSPNGAGPRPGPQPLRGAAATASSPGSAPKAAPVEPEARFGLDGLGRYPGDPAGSAKPDGSGGADAAAARATYLASRIRSGKRPPDSRER